MMNVLELTPFLSGNILLEFALINDSSVFWGVKRRSHLLNCIPNFQIRIETVNDCSRYRSQTGGLNFSVYAANGEKHGPHPLKMFLQSCIALLCFSVRLDVFDYKKLIITFSLPTGPAVWHYRV